jgi:AhpD family alkylhydroperoxidase
MTALLLRKPLRRSLDQIRYVSPVRPGQAQGLVSAVYHQVERDFGMLAPPVALHSAAPGPLAACWLMLRDTLVAPTPTCRSAKEVVAAATSLANSCPYCVSVHSAALLGLSHGADAAAIAEQRFADIGHPGLHALAVWARGGDDIETLGYPFPFERAAELIGVAVTFHYLNRMCNVFLDDSPLPAFTPRAVREPMMRLLGRIMRTPRSAGGRPAGQRLLPAARPPEDLHWAAGDPAIADTFARAAASIEAGGERSVPDPVRDLVRSELARWDGRNLGLSRAWLAEPVSRLAPEHQPAGRLALLVAMASFQVTREDVDAVRRSDEALIEFTSWSSLTAARALAPRLLERAHIASRNFSAAAS